MQQQQPTLRWIEAADARTALNQGARTMKARIAIAAVLMGMVLGLGIIVVATIGAAIDIQANSQEPRFNATAHCEDGTWSWSKNPGSPEACAHHGGVGTALR
ncbi:MAG TPA: hypothetical protein VHU15_00600 [Stellaceae bacterium]|nr:hypothetical protein [Stellaceae bacterium]